MERRLAELGVGFIELIYTGSSNNCLSDEYCDQVAESEVHVHDFHATILSCWASIILG